MKEQVKKQGFDLRTHIRDSKGNVVEEQPYRLHINGDKREFERPPGSGYFYTEGGELTRSPKKGEQVEVTKPAPEFSQDALLKEIAELKAKLAEKAVVGEASSELPEIHQTVDDIKVDDIPAVAAGKADNSEELALIAQSKKQEQKKPAFWSK